MAVILDQITVGDIRIFVVDADPSTGSGVDTPVGSLAVVSGATGLYQKVDIGATDWSIVSADPDEIKDIVGGMLVDSDTIDFTYDAIDKEITAEVKEDSITNAYLANNAVSTDKIQNSAVNSDKLADNAVIEVKIANDAVTTNKLENGAVTNDKLGNEAVTMDKISNTVLGEPDGLATLDVNGKVPLTQLPNSIMQYKGTWDADLNDPDLLDGAGNNDPEDVGNVYRVVVAGTPDLGSGPITFAVGDYVILNDDFVWEKAQTSEIVGGVSSVNGEVGDVVLELDDLDDVTITSPANGQALTYSNGEWINTTLATGTTVNGLGGAVEIVGGDGVDVSVSGQDVIIDLELDGGTLSKSVDGLKVADEGIDTAQLADNAVVAAKIADNAVVTAKIAGDAVTGAKILLDNDEALRSRNNADDAEIDLIKLNISDEVVVTGLKAPTADLDAATKKYVDDEIGALVTGVSSVNGETGVVVLDTDDIDEGTTNLYFTEKRAQDAVGNILEDSATIQFTYDDVTPEITAVVIQSGITHANLSGLGSDDHTQYALLAGRSGGQVLIGGTDASDDLSLSSTANATKGKILLGSSSAFDETDNSLGLGTANPEGVLDLLDETVRYTTVHAATSTTGNETVQIISLAPAAGSVELWKAFVTALNTSNNQSAAYERTVRVRHDGTTVTLGTVQSDYTDEGAGLVPANATFTVSGGQVRVSVTGVGSQDLDWKCVLKRMR